jgi:hypothetical protein
MTLLRRSAIVLCAAAIAVFAIDPKGSKRKPEVKRSSAAVLHGVHGRWSLDPLWL